MSLHTMWIAEFEEFDVKPTIFAYSELKSATRDFHPDMRLGEGGYGVVYKVIPYNEYSFVEAHF